MNAEQDLVVTLGNGDTVTVEKHFYGTENSSNPSSLTYDMELIEFADGAILDTLAIRNKMLADTAAAQTGSGNDTITGTASAEALTGGLGDDSISGLAGNDTLEGGADNDTLDGGRGADTYLYSLGDGSDVISEASNYNETDRLVFTDVNAEDVTFTMNAEQDLVVTLGNGDTVTVEKHFYGTQNSSNPSSLTYDMELIEFADGTTFDTLAIRDKMLADTAASQTSDGSDVISGTHFAEALAGGLGDDSISGLAGSDTLEGGAGNDTLDGGDGADTFVFSSQFANDQVTDFDDGVDRLNLDIEGVSFGDVVISDVSGDAHITVADHGTVVLQGFNAALLSEDDFLF
ncbi:hypothetical protein AB838_08180 [Rhodobacteraceae bacterium (ex Bugula neritina AB1)]|nr:hypothetical protein AB838_08180 [Rhodobacteraceae bacterium (ex Bugula neritina AB1)]